MKCAEYVEWIARKLEGSLPAVETRELEDHLVICPRCRAEALLQAGIARALSEPGLESKEMALAPDFAERVSSRAFEQARRERRSRRWGYLMPVAVNATLLLLAIVYRASVATAIKPSLSAIANWGTATAGWVQIAFRGATGPAPTLDASAAYLLGTWGPLACAAAVLILASSRIYEVSRR
jgi:predicted anti-sigma-YlaC factor YlaD